VYVYRSTKDCRELFTCCNALLSFEKLKLTLSRIHLSQERGLNGSGIGTGERRLLSIVSCF